MGLKALLDVNVLLALFDADHIFHRTARSWWLANRHHGWASCPLTQNGYLRIVSQQSYTTPARLSDAIQQLHSWAQPPNHEFWPDDLSILDDAIIDHSRLLGPRQITDVYLLALAVRHGGRFVTLDTSVSLAAVRGARAEQLVTVI